MLKSTLLHAQIDVTPITLHANMPSMILRMVEWPHARVAEWQSGRVAEWQSGSVAAWQGIIL
jgi:hypothetical protein